MAGTRLAGHALLSEGKPYIRSSHPEPGQWVRPYGHQQDGFALCECGWTSTDLLSDGQRKRAHRVHKEHVRCADGSARGEALLGGDVFPCTGKHDDGFHHFAIRPDPCPAPFCKLPFSHFEAGTMHDIPFGKPTYRIREIIRNG
jgi:hypothetical protein